MKEKLDAKLFRTKILSEIKEGIFKDSDRLPPEAALSEQFGVSRTLIRESLALIEREGFISRRHGIGTIINKHVLQVKNRIDLEMEFLEMLQDSGLEPSFRVLNISTVLCDGKMAEKLNTQQGTPVLSVEKVALGDGVPFIHCIDHISFQIVRDYSYSREDLEKPIFYFLKKYCQEEVFLNLSNIEAVLCDEKLSEYLDVEVNAPLFKLDDVGYNIDGKVVLWSEECYASKALKYTILRKRI